MPTERIYQKGRRIFNIKIYSLKETIVLNKDNKKLRQFNKWEDVFGECLKSQRDKIRYKKRSYNVLSKILVYKIVTVFLELLVEDLIKGHEFVFNPRSDIKNQARLRMVPAGIGYTKKYNGFLYFTKDNVSYKLQFTPPEKWKYIYYINYLFVCIFGPGYRKRINTLVKGGKVYYRTEKEKILSQI